MRLPHIVHVTARRLARAIIRGEDRANIAVPKHTAQGWIRDAYLTGYEDALADARAALGGEYAALTHERIKHAAREREARDMAVRDEQRTRTGDPYP